VHRRFRGSFGHDPTAGIVGPQRQPIVRDLYFYAARPLPEYVRQVQRGGSIPDWGRIASFSV